jgi:hypothetical protein
MMQAPGHLFSVQIKVTFSCQSIDEKDKVVMKIKIAVIPLHVRIGIGN